MSEQLFPTHRIRRYRFESADCLYRDFDGHRVVLDAEGGGELLWISPNPSLSLVRDGLGAEEFPLVFRDSLVGTLEGENDVDSWVRFGPPIPNGSLFVPMSGSFEGAGWLLDPTGPVMIDESHEWFDHLPNGLAVPFFRSVRTDGSWRLSATGLRCEQVDAWDIDDAVALSQRNWKVQNISRLRVLDSTFEDGTPRAAAVASHLNVASWRTIVPPANRGLILRKVFDRFHGRQRARVHVDGAVAGVWYEPGEDRERRWGVSEFGVPAKFTEGKGSIEIAIDPPSGTALWSVSRVEIFALLGTS